MPKELLIADANVTAQEEFEKIFEGMDAQLIFAENGEDALLKIKLYKPDLVIADVTMPNKDGFELCKIVKTNPELQQIPFVLLAGIFEEIDTSQQDKVGADGVMIKPLKAEEVLPLVKNLLDAGPIPLQVDKVAETGAMEAGTEGAMLSMEGLPTVEGFEQGELPPLEEIPETQLPDGEDEEAIIELTEVVDEETSPVAPPDEGAVDESLEQVARGQEDLTPKEETLDEISLEGIDLDESKGELELEEIELVEEEAPQEKEEKIEKTQIDTTEGLEFEIPEEDHLDQEKREEPLDEAMEAELEAEIDRRIDLVLEEGHEEEEEDTLLELEEGEEEKSVSREEAEDLDSLAEQIAQAETVETLPTSDDSLEDEAETLLELGEAEEPEKKVSEEGPPEELSVGQSREAEARETEEPIQTEASERTVEELEESPGEVLEAVSDDLEELSMEEVEGLETTVEELEELSVEEELEELLGEGSEEFEEPAQPAVEEPPGEVIGVETLGESPVEEDLQVEEILEEAPDGERLEGGVDEEELIDIETEGVTEALAREAVEEEGEEPLEDLGEGLLEEGPEQGEEILEEALEEPVKESVEPSSHPTELIMEEEVSEEEVDAFQKRLSSDFEVLEPMADEDAEASDARLESLVRKAVEQVLNNISESVVPELTRTIVQVASERIEKMVQQVVPELAESAIKREIERLQKEG